MVEGSRRILLHSNLICILEGVDTRNERVVMSAYGVQKWSPNGFHVIKERMQLTQDQGGW